MSLELNKDQLKGLINLVKNEVNDEDNAKAALVEALGNMFNNDMNLHRVMMTTLMNASQVNMLPPVGPFPTSASDTITGAFHGNDSFTGKILTKLKKHATYFGCFANADPEFPLHVAHQAKALLEMPTQTVLFNDLDLRFANIAVMMELLNRETVNYGEGHFTLVSEKAMNGNQPYNRTTLKFFNPTYYGNNYEIVKSVFSYEFKYLYLGNTLSNNIHFSNANGTQVIDLPDGLLAFLDNCVQALYKEYNGDFLSLTRVAEVKVEFITRAMSNIVDVCREKFVPEENLTDQEKMQAIQYFIRQHLQYNRTLVMHGHRVAELSQFDVNVSENSDLIVFGTEVYTFSRVGETYEKKKVRFEFNHLGVSNVMDEIENEDGHVMMFNLWILNTFEKEFQSIVASAHEVIRVGKFGRVY